MSEQSITTNYRLINVTLGNFQVTPQHIVGISIYEGLSSIGLRGRLLLRDFDGVIEIQEIFGGDDISIAFETLGDVSKIFEYRGKITKCGEGNASAETMAHIYEIEFCSEWWFNALTKQVSKAYKNQKIDKIIEDMIVNVCGCRSFGGFYPDQAMQLERFVSPLWTPAHTMIHLLDMCNPTEGSGGFFLYEDLYSQIPMAVTMDFLFKENFSVHPSPIELASINPQFEGAANVVWTESYFDVLRYLNQGLFQTDVIAFDYDRLNFYQSSKLVTDLDHKHLSKTIPLLRNQSTSEYKSTRVSHRYINAANAISNLVMKTLIDSNRDNRYVKLFSDVVKLNVMVPGATTRSCGQLVKMNYPSINSKADPTSRNKILEGNYLIRDIQHILKPDSFTQVMTLVSDGIGQLDRTDVRGWKK